MHARACTHSCSVSPAHPLACINTAFFLPLYLPPLAPLAHNPSRSLPNALPLPRPGDAASSSSLAGLGITADTTQDDLPVQQWQAAGQQLALALLLLECRAQVWLCQVRCAHGEGGGEGGGGGDVRRGAGEGAAAEQEEACMLRGYVCACTLTPRYTLRRLVFDCQRPKCNDQQACQDT